MPRWTFAVLCVTLSLLPFGWIWLAPSFGTGGVTNGVRVVHWYTYTSNSGGHGGWIGRSFRSGSGGEGGASGFRGGGPGRAGK